jgi:hypothetical protein
MANELPKLQTLRLEGGIHGVEHAPHSGSKLEFIEHEELLLSSLRGPGWIVFGEHTSPTRTFGNLRRKVELREVVDDRSCQTRHIAPHSGGVDGVVASDERCAFVTNHRRLRVVAFLPGVGLPRLTRRAG